MTGENTMYEEDCYPRGGLKPSLNKINSNPRSHSDNQGNLFGLSAKRKSSKKRQRNDSQGFKSRQTRDEIAYRSSSAEILSFKTVQEGMLVLGCIREVSPLALTIELPGLLYCTLQVNCISEAFTRELSERLESGAIDEGKELHTLHSIFKQGQFIPTRIIQIELTGTKAKMFLSMKPSDVNVNYYHLDFRSGMLIWAAVSEKSDHGYILEIGVKHVRIILPFKQVEDKKEYVIGEPLWCVVKSATSSNQVTTLSVSALQGDVDTSKQREVSHIEKVLPGTCVMFRAEKGLGDGLEGTIFTDSVAYVNEAHLSEPSAPMEKYLGETLPALVLYVQPTTRFSYLTLRTSRMELQPNLSVGQILPAQVISRSERGIFVKLSKKERGFITPHRIKNSLNLSNFSDLEALIEAKYPRGSTHKCRILDYAFMDRLYVCTFEQQVLDEKIFTAADIKVGEVIKGTVQEVKQTGITLKIGNLRGFVNNEHLSNARYNEIFKSKFKTEQTVTGRVWLNKGPSNIKVTLKSAFLESDVCLKDYEKVQVNSQYPGMVVKITASGALVKFYNDVQGWLKQAPNSQHPLKQLLYEGQVVTVWVIDKEGTRLTLSLEDPSTCTLNPEEDDAAPDLIEAKPRKPQKIRVGQVVTGTVIKFERNGICVSVGSNNLEGFVPVNHLCSDPSLSAIIFRYYRVGDEIADLICISNRKRKVLSASEHRYFTQEKYEIPKRLKNNGLIRCYFSKAKKTMFSVTCPVRQNVKDVIVNYQNSRPLKKYHPIMVRVSDLKSYQHCAIGSAKLSDVFNFDFGYSARQLDRYLDDVALIQRKSIERNDPLGCFTPGERVLCTVTSFNEKGCTVTVRDDVKGVVARRNCPENLKLHQTHTGVVLWVDFDQKHVEMALKAEIVNKINATQDGAVHASPNGLIPCEVLSVNEDFVLCVMGPLGNGQLAFIPTQLHENDFTPDCSYYEEIGEAFDFKVVLEAKGRIIGFESPFKRDLFHNSNSNSRKSMGDSNKNGFDDSDEEISIDGSNDDLMELDEVIYENFKENDLVDSLECVEEGNTIDFDDQEEVVDDNKSDVTPSKDNDVLDELNDWEEEEDQTNNSEDSEVDEESDFDGQEEGTSMNNLDHEEEKEDKAGVLVDSEDKSEEDPEEVTTQITDFSNETQLSKRQFKRKIKQQEMEEIENIEQYSLVVDNENSDRPDSEEASRIRRKTMCMEALAKIKPVNRRKKKENRNPSQQKRAKRIDKLRKSLRQIQEIEEVLYDPSYELNIDKDSVLPGVQHFFDSDKEEDVARSSEDDDAELSEAKLNRGKKRKLSPREQVDLVRAQEEYLRSKEEEMLNSSGVPQNVEQFDRRLLGEPNSSELWAQYIAFHIQSTEIDKARAVVKRALKTIQQSAVQERLNIWITYLNLEGMYGTRETFDGVFEEAVRCNDALTIYLEAIKILTETSSENADEKIRKAKSKFKQEARMYIEIGKIYYEQNRLADARRLKDGALRTILDKKKHVPLIVQFAIMEFNKGEENHGEALFETILQSDPRRTDVWGTYVDQLVKKNKVDLARRVLQRAVAQKLNYKKMKVLYKKFQEFEQKYGTSETQAHVKELLREYASQFANA